MSKSDNQVDKNLSKTDKVFTVKEVAGIVEESPHTIRNWLKELKHYIPVTKNQAGYNVFDNEALEKVKEIKQLHREQGMAIKQVEYYFATGGKEFVVPPKKEIGHEIAEELKALREELAEVREYNRRQEEFNQALIQELQKQREFIKQRDEGRDKQLMIAIREMQDTKKQIASVREKRWYEFWK
ncbi:DUF3967 domain-containing protein [Ectobacillus antri]|uniref:DUF3967 domain-containing protein n=1 Tax=Ectobacillus antri TaxID=2486280 RepID=UPI000F5958E9|nr:DUF3967 domain-containing protein [Ectobacillus antri]